ncbi:MAG: enoyl-CoA hydratase [Chloroflexi bacterium]|nr:enoyl-CoA hydratase [Chloroflexota bacterium]
MPQVLTDLADGVQTITLNQPDKLNALSSTMMSELLQVLRAAERDDAVQALVLTGAGRGFSAGADLTQSGPGDAVADVGDALRARYVPVITRLHALEKPVLAAINGVAAGAGLSLALACDLRYAGESARLVVAFVRIGLVPDAGMLYFLPRLIGPGKTLELAWTGDPLSAAEAYEIGMLNNVLPDDQLLAETQSLAARLARGPHTALSLMKRAVSQTHELPLERVLELEANYQTIAARDPNFAEGVAAFREKRPPRFNQ